MKIGIDLGTTNSALAFIDPREAEGSDFPPVHVLPIPQKIASGAVEARRTLPSFLYLEEEGSVGEYAREQGALVPTRMVHSAKSWLSNAEVDRTAKILPWDAQEQGRVLSPVEASARYLKHMATAWEASGRGAIAGHDVVLTVPASFDEEARELTVAAAREAGIEKLTLLEEPAAAFYAWIANHLAQSQKSLTDGMTVLVVDVGGGTSDFTLIRVARAADRVEFTRTAVGRHLLLGGDNLDLTLSWLVESKLKTQLSLRQRSALRRQCSAAKERLLSTPDLAAVEITVLGSGAALIGGAKKTSIMREEALELAMEGFVPFCRLDEKPQEDAKSLFREGGLPYVSDPAVSFPRFCGNEWRRWSRAGTANARWCWRITISTWRWRWARRTTATCAGRAAACWCAEDCRARISWVWSRPKRPRCGPYAWFRAAPKKARRCRWISRVCNWSPTSRSRSGCTAHSSAPTMPRATLSNFPRPRRAWNCTSMRRSRR